MVVDTTEKRSVKKLVVGLEEVGVYLPVEDIQKRIKASKSFGWPIDEIIIETSGLFDYFPKELFGVKVKYV